MVIESATRENVAADCEHLKVNKVMIYPYAHLTSTLGSPEVHSAILKGLEEALRRESD